MLKILMHILPEMVKKNPEIEKLIDRSVRRVLRTKFILGLFDNPYIDIEEVEKGVQSRIFFRISKRIRFRIYYFIEK